MSSSYNKVILVGNLTRDPEVLKTKTGLPIAKLGLAVNRRHNTNGENREEVTFVDIDAFGRQADVLSQYAAKGTCLLVEGRLKLETWSDRQSGQNRSKLGVVLENFQFLGGKQDSIPEQGPEAGRPRNNANLYREYARG